MLLNFCFGIDVMSFGAYESESLNMTSCCPWLYFITSVKLFASNK